MKKVFLFIVLFLTLLCVCIFAFSCNDGDSFSKTFRNKDAAASISSYESQEQTKLMRMQVEQLKRIADALQKDSLPNNQNKIK